MIYNTSYSAQSFTSMPRMIKFDIQHSGTFPARFRRIYHDKTGSVRNIFGVSTMALNVSPNK